MSQPRKKIVVICYGAGHSAMCIPVVKRLRELYPNSIEVEVLALTTARAAMKRAGIDSIGFGDLGLMSSRAQVYGERLVAELPVTTIDRSESIAYLGLNFEELVDKFGETEAAARYAEAGRHAFLPHRTMRRFLASRRPDLVISTNSPRCERAAIEVAGELEIPALCLVDLFALQEVAWIGQPGYATRICVLSEWVRQLILRAGRKPEEVAVTGNPAFDRLADPARVDASRRLRANSGWRDKFVVLWASQPESEKHPFADRRGDARLPRLIDEEMIRLARLHDDWHVVLRFHPSESVSISNLPDNVVVSGPADDLTADLINCDAVVVTASTVGLEGALVGRPVVAIEASVFAADAPFAKMGLAIGVPDIAAVEAALERIRRGKWQPSGELPQVGSATCRVVDLAIQLLGLDDGHFS